jgi:predicted DNA-binding transcriptional regulator YafY
VVLLLRRHGRLTAATLARRGPAPTAPTGCRGWLAAEELAEPAQRPDRVDLDRAWQERSTRFRLGGDQVTVLMRVTAARREDLAGKALAVRAEEADADGWLRLEATFQDSRHAEWALWQLGANAEALAPQWLRTSLRNRAAALATCYGDSP